MKLLTIFLLLICVPILALAQQKSRKIFPYNYSIDDLPNGLRLITVPTDYPNLVALYIVVSTGSRNEIEPGKSGYAHLFEHLMFKGTDKIPSGQFSKIVAKNGGEDNAFTNHDVTAYFQRVAKDRLPTVMAMEADRMANLRLSKEDVATERDVILEERRSRVDNDPSSILQEQMMAALYTKHPYGIPIIGWAHEVAALDRDDALSFYKRFYAPNNALLVVAGDVEPDEVRKLADETFGKLPPHGGLNGRSRPKEPEHQAPLRVELEDARAGRIDRGPRPRLDHAVRGGPTAPPAPRAHAHRAAILPADLGRLVRAAPLDDEDLLLGHMPVFPRPASWRDFLHVQPDSSRRAVYFRMGEPF